jgi:integrase
MGTIETRRTRDGMTHYRAKLRVQGFPTQSRTFERKADAKAWLSTTSAALLEGRLPRIGSDRSHTVAELIERYTTDVLPLRTQRVRVAKAQLEWWKKELGPVRLSDLSSSHIARCRDKLAARQTRNKTRTSPATINRYLAALSTPLTVASREWDWIDQNPMRRVTKAKEPRGRTRFLSRAELNTLLVACKASRSKAIYPMVVLAVSTGMRLGEITALTRGQVDLERNRITLTQTKNGDIRVIPLAGHARECVAAICAGLTSPDERLFPGNAGKSAIDTKKAWTNALNAAGIQDFRFHDLRHCAASFLLEAGATTPQLAEILGHRTLQMVKRYAHLSQSVSHEIVATMNAQIFPVINAGKEDSSSP